MHYLILGIIAVIWGGGILLSFFLGSSQLEGDGAYGVGQIIGLIFGGLLFIAGLYAIVKNVKRKS